MPNLSRKPKRRNEPNFCGQLKQNKTIPPLETNRFSLPPVPPRRQGLLAGLMASTPGLEGKPIEAVENACASGGQAVLSVIHKLQLGMGETGIAVGYEKMRDAEGKMDGKLIGKVLGYFSHPDERAGKVFVFPHLFAEVMQAYMAEYGVTERDLAAIPVQEYANAKFNPCAQMNKVQITLDQAVRIEGLNRYVV